MSTVARALSGAGIAVLRRGVDPDADVDVYVFTETLTPDDRGALSVAARPTVAVLNKADLAALPAGGPLALAPRCRELERDTAVPVRPLAALPAVAGTDPAVLDAAMLRALRALAAGADTIVAQSRARLTADLDVFGTAVAVAALRSGADDDAVAPLLRAVSGLDQVCDGIDRAGAVLRYRRLAGRASVPDRMAAAVEVLAAAGAPGPGDTADPLRRAIHWRRYAGGPVSAVHRACAMDAARGELRQWIRAGGVPAALP